MAFSHFVIPKEGFNTAGEKLLSALKKNLNIADLTAVTHGVLYTIEGVSAADSAQIAAGVFEEKPVNTVLGREAFTAATKDAFVLITEALPGQYDQRADYAAQCAQVLIRGPKPTIKSADVYAFYGAITEAEIARIKAYLINPVDTREANLEAENSANSDPETEDEKLHFVPFTGLSAEAITAFLWENSLAMSAADAQEIQQFFRAEGREPRLSELLFLDMYWSDHCRHTTFLTHLQDVKIEDKSPRGRRIKAVWEGYIAARKSLKRDKPVSLMDLATAAAREQKAEGNLPDIEESEEINAASIHVPVRLAEGKTEDWLYMFKNETHNHPTEISPYGGASTALGGCIRDPMSGRSYVFMGVRYTGSGDPRTPLSETLPGKLSQRQINQEAAHGFAGYGNQIGVPTLKNYAIFHEGYTAKRFCCGAVAGATRASEVRREALKPGDIVVLLGGKTGRDGIGGATGSSKSHDDKAVATAGAEVQKGNPPVERALQRLFRNPDFKAKVKKCNDGGAGGIANAVGEMADGVAIELKHVPLKYTGLTPTETALSESQERMFIGISAEEKEAVLALAEAENVEATAVATVTKNARLVIKWAEKTVVDLPRELLDTGWAERTQRVKITR